MNTQKQTNTLNSALNSSDSFYHSDAIEVRRRVCTCDAKTKVENRKEEKIVKPLIQVSISKYIENSISRID